MIIKKMNTKIPTMSTNQVNLDPKTLKALASQNRLYILQLLKLKSMNLTHLSKMLGLPKSTTHKDLSILIKSGLVNKVDTPRKWRYYELTAKGAMLFSDESKMIIFSGDASKNSIHLSLDPNASHAGSADPTRSDNVHPR